MEIEIIFDQSYQVAEYTPTKAGIVIRMEVDDESPEAAIEEAYLLAKTQVWGQLGLDYEVTEGVAKLTHDFGGAPAKKMAKKAKGKSNGAAKSRVKKSSGSKGSRGKRKDSFDWERYEEEDREYAWEHLGENSDEWWDNREDKRNPRAPDFKLKSDGDVALWLSDEDEESEAELAALEALDE